MALVSTHTIPRILDLLSVGKLETAAMMVTHGKSINQLELSYRPHVLFPLEQLADTCSLRPSRRFQVRRDSESIRRLPARSRDQRTESQHRVLEVVVVVFVGIGVDVRANGTVSDFGDESL